ncbi:MAG: glycosyltransferase family 2 protein [Eubacteriales bacterium]|jgi:glycosyltransferase involved in cell wall biosynthesis
MLIAVIPLYNEEKAVRRHIAQIDRILKADGIDVSFLLVNDGSRDGTWNEIRALTKELANVRAVSFSRNFGKESAIHAGLSEALRTYPDADRFLVMDSDLQHPPRFVKHMLELMDSVGADIVDGIKEFRGNETLKSKILARGFYGTLAAVSGMELNNSSDFKILRRAPVEEIVRMPEGNRFFRAMVDFVGFKRVDFPFSVDDRDDGTSRFSVKSLLKLAFNAILGNSSGLLYLPFLGAFLCVLGALTDAVVMIVRACTQTGVTNAAWVILCVLLTGALVLAGLGVLGAYIARLYDEVRERRRYIVSERI